MDKCKQCLGSGFVCVRCGKAWEDDDAGCQCGPANGSPMKCTPCGGSGKARANRTPTHRRKCNRTGVDE